MNNEIVVNPISTLRPMSDEFGIAFHVGSLDVRWYAIMSILGYATAILIFCLVIAFKYKVKYEPAFYFIFPALPMCILGARFWSACIGDLNWDNFFNFKSGGLAIQGGVVFGLITGIIYFPLVLRLPKYHVRVEVGDKVYVRQPSFFLYADAIIPTILIGQAIGRWGNFFNGEIFGSPVGLASQPNGLSWLQTLMPGVYDHMVSVQGISGCSLPNYGAGYVFQPLFLYESFMCICAFLLIYLVLTNIYKIRTGVAAGSYFVAYGIIRYLMEPLRNSSFNFSGTYVMNGILLVFGIAWIVYCQWIYPLFRHVYVNRGIQSYFDFLKQKKLHNNPAKTDKEVAKCQAKLAKLQTQYDQVNAKTTDTYEDKITKQFKLKQIKQKMDVVKERITIDHEQQPLNWKQFYIQNKIQILRKDGECIYFANR